jgi:hypothetical protein
VERRWQREGKIRKESDNIGDESVQEGRDWKILGERNEEKGKET